MQELVALYKVQELYNKAALLLLEALEGHRLTLGDTHPHTLESWHNLIDLYETWNKPEKPKSGKQNGYKLKILKSDMSLLKQPKIFDLQSVRFP